MQRSSKVNFKYLLPSLCAKQLGWLPTKDRALHKGMCVTHRAFYKQGPGYLQARIVRRVPGCFLREANSLQCKVPKQSENVWGHGLLDSQTDQLECAPSGAHRPRGARYGEYTFCPPQRWVHNLQHGTVGFLYHPCVNPRLKEDLCFLARACMHKHIISPHIGLTKERPLVLVSWTATLEMQLVNLTEATAWLRQSTGPYAQHEEKDEGTYDYLLIRPAAVGPSDGKVCPEAQMLGKHLNLHQSRPGTVERKRGEKGLTRNRHEVMKRKRALLQDTVGSGMPTEIMPSPSPGERHEGHSRGARGVAASAERTSLTPSNSTLQEHQQVASEYNTSTGDKRAKLSSEERARPRSGWAENDRDSEAKSTRSVPGEGDHANVHLAEAGNARAIPREAGNARAIPGEAEIAQDIPREEEAKRSTVEEGQHADSGAIGNSSGTSNVEQEAMGQGRNGTKGSSRGDVPSSETGQSVGTNPATESSRPQNPGEAGTIKVNVSEPFVGLTNHSQSHVSSKADDAGDGAGIPNATRPEEQGEATKGGETSLTSEGVRDGVPKQQYPDARNLSTTSPGAPERGGGVGKEQCSCLQASSQELVPHQKHQALAQAGALGSVAHVHTGQGVPRAAQDVFVRTPRTEEAAWAAAALTFLFVLLTLSLLYTRLWRKFRKSESLYWAPGSDLEGKETVSAVIKRRLTVGQARRKKRQSYKKRPLVFYENLSDSSD